MQEIPRALLLPPPSAFPPKQGVRPTQGDAEARVAERGGHTPAPPGGQSFITLVEPRREDTVDLKGKQFRFRPYTNRATADAAREADDAKLRPNDLTPIDETAERGIGVDVLDGFGAGARERNSTAFLASYIAQHRLGEGLHNPKYAAASEAYRRAGGSPTIADNQPRVVSLAV
jgi:hypothetical protein